MNKKDTFNELKIELSRSNLSLPTPKLRNLKKDPLMFARVDLLSGAIYFEFVPNAYRPYSCFLTSQLGEIFWDSMSDSKENEVVFIQFGSFFSIPEMVGSLESKLLHMKMLFKDLIL